jgi:hypothetical protein
MAPFRWTIAKREQLGSLIAPDARRNLNRDDFLPNLREASARVLAFSDDADLAFIGRTPENFYDYISGILSGVDDAPALHLVQFSLRWSGEGGVGAMDPAQLAGYFDYLGGAGLDAASIATGSRRLALVDFVAGGGTMQNFVELLHLQAKHTGTDWHAVQRRLRIIGLRVRTHNSPNTWRWQQHQDWLDLIAQASIKNVSAPANFLWYIANDQPKVTLSFHPGLWDRDDKGGKTLSEAQLAALNLAVQLYDAGQSREERLALAGLIANAPEMRQAATRRLVLRIKGL